MWTEAEYQAENKARASTGATVDSQHDPKPLVVLCATRERAEQARELEAAVPDVLGLLLTRRTFGCI